MPELCTHNKPPHTCKQCQTAADKTYSKNQTRRRRIWNKLYQLVHLSRDEEDKSDEQ